MWSECCVFRGAGVPWSVWKSEDSWTVVGALPSLCPQSERRLAGLAASVFTYEHLLTGQRSDALLNISLTEF